MFTVEQQLVNIILTHKDALIRQVCTRLEKLDQSHYEVIPYERHLEREEALLAALLQGLQEPEYTVFMAFIERIGGQRSNEGYALFEVQRALNIFEEELWRILTSTQPVDGDLVAMLSLCNRLFGRAKDHLAKIYHHQRQNVQSELDDLREKFQRYYPEQKSYR